MQAWRFGSPSISTRHSWQLPMRHHGPRGAPDTGVVRNTRTPLASSAAATVSPARASKVRPSKSNAMTLPASGSLRNIEAIRREAGHTVGDFAFDHPTAHFERMVRRQGDAAVGR